MVANLGKYIRQATGTFTHYNVIHRFYFTPLDAIKWVNYLIIYVGNV